MKIPLPKLIALIMAVIFGLTTIILFIKYIWAVKNDKSIPTTKKIEIYFTAFCALGSVLYAIPISDLSQQPTSVSTYTETSIETEQILNTTFSSTESLTPETEPVTETTKIFTTTPITEYLQNGSSETDSVINCTNMLTDELSPDINKIHYILHSTYSNNYGFEFQISDVSLCYVFTICEKSGKVIEQYTIDNEGISESPKLDKNKDYDIYIEAKTGYPKFTVIVTYPENDRY